MINWKLKVVSLSTGLLTVSCMTACLQTPGIEEPMVAYCTIMNTEYAECVYPEEPSYKERMAIIDMIGYKAVRPKGLSVLASHHEVLHRELNQCKGVSNE